MAEGKWVEGLRADMPVAEAARLVLAARFETVRNFLLPATGVPHPDPESVHQLRVGTRRAGAAVRAFADCLPRKHYRSTRRALRVLRQAAGDARDWDVFLIGLTASKPLATAAGRPALDFLIGYALGERSAAQTRLAAAAALAGPPFDEESRVIPGLAHEPESEPVTFGGLASDQFGSLLATFDEEIGTNPTAPPALHRLRILGKRVRYALEIFAACFAPPFTDAVYPVVEQLQDLLGDLQDSAVGIERLSSLRDRVKGVASKEWPRLRPGFEGQAKLLRAKLPAGRKAFQKWRKEWAKISRDLKIEVVTATVT